MSRTLLLPRLRVFVRSYDVVLVAVLSLAVVFVSGGFQPGHVVCLAVVEILEVLFLLVLVIILLLLPLFALALVLCAVGRFRLHGELAATATSSSSSSSCRPVLCCPRSLLCRHGCAAVY